MKLLLLLLLPSISFCQAKKDNAILIDSAGLTYNKIIGAFVSSGYPIDKTTQFYYSTNSAQKKLTSIKMAIYLKDSVYVLQGWFNTDTDVSMRGVTSKSSFEQIEFRGMKGSPFMIAWTEMVTIANKLSTNFTFTKLQ